MLPAEQGPVIILPEDSALVAKLHLKNLEYGRRKRENPYQPPETKQATFAQLILGTLLLQGEIDTYELARQYDYLFVGPEQVRWYEKYCGIITAYISGELEINLPEQM